MSKKRKRKKNRISALSLTAIFTVFLSYAVYTNLDSDGFDVEQVYRINNVAMNVESSDDFSGKVVSEQPTLTMSGDTKKVKQMKDEKFSPEITLDLKGKTKEGIYKVEPKVKDEKIGVNYTFKPASMEVKLIESKLQQFEVVERDYNLAKEGYTVGEMVAVQKAELKVTDEQKLLIGNVIAEIDASKLTDSTRTKAKVLVLDKKGHIMKDINVVTPTIDVDVNLTKLGWLKIQEDINAISKEIATLKKELAEKQKEIKTVKDVLRKKDLKKEIKFREARIKKRTTELETKKSSIDALKKSQEAKKAKENKKSLENGGELEKSLLKDNE